MPGTSGVTTSSKNGSPPTSTPLSPVIVTAALEPALICGPRVNRLYVSGDVWILGTHIGSGSGSLEGKAHLHIGPGELITCQPPMLAQLAVDEGEVPLDLGICEAFIDLARDTFCDGLDDERHRGGANPTHDELHEKWGHQ